MVRGLAALVIMAIAVWMTSQAWTAARTFGDRPLDFDEAIHALPAYQAALDLGRADLIGFVAHSYDQDQLAAYPFLHSWLLAPFLMVSAADTVIARLANSVFVWASAALAAVCAARLALSERQRPWAAVIGAGLVVVSLPIWVYANTVLLEAAGLMITLAWLAAYQAWGEHDERPARLVIISLLAAATFFTKYSFGVFVLAGLALAETLTAAARWRHARAVPGLAAGLLRRWGWLVGPALLSIGLWLVLPDKLTRLVGYSGSQAGSLSVGSLAYWLYVPVNAVRLYSAGPVTAGLMIAALPIGIGLWGQHAWRVTIAAVVAGMLALTWVPQKDARFLYTVAPLILPAAAALGVHLAAVLARAQWGRWLALGTVCLELGLGLQRLTRYRPALETVFNTSPDTRAALAFALEHSLVQGSRPLVVNGWYQLNAQALSWEYYARFGGTPAGDGYRLAVQGEFDRADADARQALLRDLRLDQATTVITIDGSPAGAVTGWELVEPLIASGDLEVVAQSPPYTLVVWPRELQERLLAGEVAGGQPITFEVRLNVYSVR